MGGHSKEVFLHLMTIEVQPTVKFAGKIQTTHFMICFPGHTLRYHGIVYPTIPNQHVHIFRNNTSKATGGGKKKRHFFACVMRVVLKTG